MPKIDFSPNSSAIQTGLVMEFIAPGTGVGSAIVMQQNEGFFQNIGNSITGFFSNIGSGSGGPKGNKPGIAGTPTNYTSNNTVYYAAAVVVLIVVVLVAVYMRRKK